MVMPTKRTPAKKSATKKTTSKKSAKKKTAVKKKVAKKASSPSKPLPKISDLQATANRVAASKEQGKKPGSSNASRAKSSAGSAPEIDLSKVWDSLVKWFKNTLGQK